MIDDDDEGLLTGIYKAFYKGYYDHDDALSAVTVLSAIGSGAAGAPSERGKGERGTGLSPQTPLHSAALLQGKLLSSRRPNRSAARNQNSCLAIPR